jgi:DNA-binding transcriptional LysR family regulator
MELRQLQYFAAVARHRSFTRAAESLYITQPALSQQIRRLEAELGLALLRRTTQGVELTPAGADLLAHADRVTAEVTAARALMDRHAGVSRGVARVAATAADAPRLPEALAAFHAEHPGIQVALRQGSAHEVVDLTRRGAVDVAVLALAGEPPAGADAHPLGDEPLRVAVPLDDPLVDAARVAVHDLQGRPFILAEPGSALRATVLQATQAAGFSPLPLFEVGDPQAVRFLVRAGLGISLVPASWLERPGPVVGAADLKRPPRHRLSLLTPAAGPSPAGRLLFAQLSDALR